MENKRMGPKQGHGIVTKDSVKMTYGKDSSGHKVGSDSDARGQGGFKGGTKDLSRTLGSGTAPSMKNG